MDRIRRGQRRLLRDLTDPATPSAAVPPDRHARQARFAPFGPEAQARLRQAHAVIVGVGALGSHVATTLARAGVGRLTLIDRDIVDAGNLHRQILFDDADARAGAAKAEAAATALGRVDPALHLAPVVAHFDAALWRELTAEWARSGTRPDLLVDGTDNFATRYLLNDLALAEDLPWVHGAAIGAEGRAMVVLPGRWPCLRCLLPVPPDAGALATCETAGVLAPAVAHVAAYQSMEALKLLGGRTAALTRGMFVLDAWAGRFEVLFRDAAPRPDCASCGPARELPALHAAADDAVVLCGRDAVQLRPARATPLALSELGGRLRTAGAELSVSTDNPRMLRVSGADWRMTVFADGRALVFGVGSDAARARALYDRFVGA